MQGFPPVVDAERLPEGWSQRYAGGLRGSTELRRTSVSAQPNGFPPGETAVRMTVSPALQEGFAVSAQRLE